MGIFDARRDVGRRESIIPITSPGVEYVPLNSNFWIS